MIGGHIASAARESLMKVIWGLFFQRGKGAEPMVRESEAVA